MWTEVQKRNTKKKTGRVHSKTRAEFNEKRDLFCWVAEYIRVCSGSIVVN